MMVNFRVFIFLICFIFLNFEDSISQNQVQKELEFAIDSIQVDIENRLSNSEVLPNLNRLRRRAYEHHLYYEYATTYLLESNQHFLNTDWENALISAEKSLEIGNSNLNGKQKAEIQIKALNSIGYVYSYQGDFSESLAKRLVALQIATDENCSKQEMGNMLTWIADDYRHLNQQNKALEYIKKGGDYLSHMTNEGVIDYYYIYCQSLIALGENTLARDKLSELDQFIEKSNTFSDYDKNSAYLQSTKLHGEFALLNKSYDEAIEYYQRYLHYSTLLKSSVHIGIALNKIARTYQFSGNTQEALRYFKSSYDSCINDGAVDYAFKNANSIASIYALNNDYENAFKYSQSAFELKDSLNSTERIKELNYLEAKFQAGKKVKEIAELKLSNAEHELSVAKNNRVMLIGGFVAATLLVTLGFLYYTNRQKRLIVEKEKKSIEQQQQVNSLQAMINGQETERIRIAKDLHDSMGGTFSTIKMHLSSLEHEIDDKQNAELLEKCISIISNASTDVRRIAHNMMPEVLIKFGLLHSIEELTSNINSSKQLKVTFQHFGINERLTPNFEIMLYRIVQELINNIIKHSDATEAIIQFIKEKNRLSITIEDNGKGFSSQVDTKGMGLTSVEERVQYLNGKLSIDSETAIGTTVMMEFLLSES